MPSKKTKVQIPVNGEFSKLIVQRSRDSYGYAAIWIRWGGADVPVIEVTPSEALAIADAIRLIVRPVELSGSQS